MSRRDDVEAGSKDSGSDVRDVGDVSRRDGDIPDGDEPRQPPRVPRQKPKQQGRSDSSDRPTPRRSRGQGRLKIAWGVDVDLEVPKLVEALIKGPWDPEGKLWARQVDVACEVCTGVHCIHLFFKHFLRYMLPACTRPHARTAWLECEGVCGNCSISGQREVECRAKIT